MVASTKEKSGAATGASVLESPIAEKLEANLKEISVAEFFERNKHILGFDSTTRAMLTSVKEGVDNALDACEEAHILPDLRVEIHGVGKNEYKMVIEDNGPGISKKEIPNVFGRLLYGSRFHAIRQSRGQQGIGISAVVMYGQLTTGRPATIISKIGQDMPAYEVDLLIETKKNKPEIIRREVVNWDKSHGTRVEITIAGRYVKDKKQSVYEYLRSTAIVNPHAELTFVEPDGKETIFPRVTDEIPKPTQAIKPHPEGIELGMLMKMAKSSESYKLTAFLVNEFSRISYRTAREICNKAELDELLRPQDLNRTQAKRLMESFRMVKIMAPPTDCLSPIGDILIKKGLKKEIDTKFAYTTTRPPAVFSGSPFQVEAGIVYGGDMPKDKSVKILRYANRVPLLYQQGGCVSTHGLETIDWRQYGLEQRGGEGIPVGPAWILIHVASTNVPFTSESKEAIADIPEIKAEVELALRECARKMKAHINKKERMKKIAEKYEIIQKVLPELARKTSEILDKPEPSIDKIVTKIMNIVVVEDEVQFEKTENEKVTHVKVNITNYTPTGRKFKVYVKVPQAIIQKIDPKPEKVDEQFIIWDLKRIPSSEKRALTFDIMGLDKGDYDEADVYVDGLKMNMVIGADPL